MSFEPFKIPCIILSGGKSQRMGEDKSLLPFSSSNSLAEFQYKKLKPYFKDIYISSKTNKFPFLNLNNLIIDEEKEIFSPILALYTILQKFDEVFILPVDTPFIKIKSIEKLINKSQDFDITIAKTPLKTHNLCGVFSNNIKPFINSMIEDDIHKINYLVKNSNFLEVEFENEDEFLNINDKDDYSKAKEIIN